MAAVSLLVTTPDTTQTPNDSAAYTPTLGRLQVVIVNVKDSVDFASTLTNSAGLTFSRVTTVATTPGTAANFIVIYIADALTSVTSSQTVSFADIGDVSLGTIITVLEVSGMTKTGLTALLQVAVHNAGGFDETPLCTFSNPVSTNNPTIGAMMNNNNPAAITPPTNWTELVDNGHASPSSGQEVCHRDSGYTGTTITWGSLFGTAGCAIAIELDASTASTIVSPNPAGMSAS